MSAEQNGEPPVIRLEPGRLQINGTQLFFKDGDTEEDQRRVNEVRLRAKVSPLNFADRLV